ncbi:ATP-grasp domain-containing protein [Streptomyces sp. CBMA152]|uniref:ATP-grasp domain-containing protein n=1 Tax=Streptomyces sp. CBMA152 TaxID=1896312 RepID=UPI001660399F|nr:ATP-grasp domain-containing protein [Streptomyces sp. CBMA152]MBD0743144.1 biotin carboxylase [Streptomyces sp. CBMA152]
MADRPVIMVGFVPVAVASLAQFQPDRSVIIIDEPDVIRKRDVRAQVADAQVVREVIGWEYQLAGAADEFANAFPDLDPAAIAALQEYATPFAARLAERYGLPGAGFGAAQIMRDKELLRKVTAAAGIPNPRSVSVADEADLRKFMDQHEGPVVLKPANRQGSVGTRILSGADEVDAAWIECTDHDEGIFVPDRPRDVRMLAEQYVAGAEYSVEMLVDRGTPLFANVTEKTLFPGDRPVEMGHVVPADISQELQDLLFEQTRQVLKAVGFGSGVVHCEWIVSASTAFLVECAGRFAGDGIIDLIDRAYSMDLVKHFWTVMKGEPVPGPLPSSAQRAAAVRFLHTRPGLVETVDGMDQARQVPGVVSCTVVVKAGDRVRRLRSSKERIGAATAVAETVREARSRTEEALARINIVTVPTI